MATRTLHAEAERAGIMPTFLKGELSVQRYVGLLRNLHAIYATLEPALMRRSQDPRVGPVCRTDIFRLSALECDLAALTSSPDWRDRPILAATELYVHRLLSIESEDPVRLVAHAYVRYLGDLNGGQVLGRIAARMTAHLTLPCVAFYDFGGKAAAGHYAQALRGALDKLPLKALETDAVVDEAQWAFKQHSHLFQALQTSTPMAFQAL